MVLATNKDYPKLSARSLGWLRYLHRKTHTPDNWDKDGQPHEHWDNRTGEPTTSSVSYTHLTLPTIYSV